MSFSPLTSSTVFFGGCFTSDDVDPDCQVEMSGCPAGNFHTGLMLEDVEDDECDADDVTTTKCDSLGLCTPSGCAPGSTPVQDDNCNLVLNEGADNTVTVYGACKEIFSNVVSGCFYRPQDCLDANGDGVLDSTESERYLDPDTLFRLLADPATSGVTFSDKLYCDCSDVKVGACVTEGLGTESPSYYCAVHPDSCSPNNEVFVNARQLLQSPKNFTRQCRLCDGDDIPSLSRANTDAFLKGKQQDILAGGSTSPPKSPETPTSGNTINSNSNNNGEMTIIIATVVGSVIGLLALICIGRRYCCGHKSTIEDPKDLEVNEEGDTSVAGAATGAQNEDTESGIPAEGKEIS